MCIRDSGSAVVRDGDLFGHAVNVAARITALAGAGHAVITDPICPPPAELDCSPCSLTC